MSASAVPFREALATYLKIGLLSFGGPAGQIALMHRVFVDEKKWLKEERFLGALNYCMLLPGPEAMQLATYSGWLLHGVRGGIAAGLLFVLPGFFVILALSMLYATLGDLPLVEGLLFGLKAAVLAVVVEALLKVSKRALKSPAMVVIAIAAFIGIALLRLPFPLIILLAALSGVVLSRRAKDDSFQQVADKSVENDSPDDDVVRVSPHGHVTKVLSIGILVWVAPILLIAMSVGLANVYAQEALFFSKAALVTFGGAYAVLAYVAQQAVSNYGWLQTDEMVTGLGLAETTPGPLILVLVFVGFMGGFRDPGAFSPLVSGTLGAIIVTWVTFIPCFIWIFLGAPYIERLRNNVVLQGALSAVTASVVGVIANLSLWFALHVLFSNVTDVGFGPFTFAVPTMSTFDWQAGFIAIAAALALFVAHANLFVVLIGSALIGILLKTF